MLRRSCAALAASRTRSSSSCRYLSNSATTSRGLRRLPSDQKRSTQPASVRIRARSSSMTLSMPGRSTLTATSRPLCSTAKWTWAMEALAIGSVSNCLNTADSGLPRAFSTRRADSSLGKGGTRSCSRASSSATSGGSRSRRVDSIWPNLTKMGPRCSRAWRRRSPRGASSRRPVDSTRASRLQRGRRRLCSSRPSSPKRRAIRPM